MHEPVFADVVFQVGTKNKRRIDALTVFNHLAPDLEDIAVSRKDKMFLHRKVLIHIGIFEDDFLAGLLALHEIDGKLTPIEKILAVEFQEDLFALLILCKGREIKGINFMGAEFYINFGGD